MKIVNRISTLIAATLVLLCISCTTHQPDATHPINHTQETASKHTMVILVHGTVLPIPHPQVFGTSLHQSLACGRRLKKSWYQLYLDTLKNTSIYRYQPSGPDGLNPASMQASANLVAEMYQTLAGSPDYSFYSFGWNGQLSHEKRVQAAIQLYQQLQSEIARLKARHGTVNVVIICHSHGGNVAHNLAHAEQKFKQHLVINKLILLGTPIQSETADYVKASCFEKVYNFYSHGDYIQKIDIFSTDDDYSVRTFQPHPTLTQIEVTCGDLKPGHIELWLFRGKHNVFCRHSLALSPFPLVVFLPVILQQLDATFQAAPLVKLNIERTETQRLFTFSDGTKNAASIVYEQTLAPYQAKVLAL